MSRIPPINKWLRAARPRLLPYSRWGLARRIVMRANAVREEGQYLAAAMLYEEAARATPRDAAIHIQCGHMFKEAGEFPRAEEHYLAALALNAGDADLSLQLGHFYKVAGRPQDAETAYARAATLAPGWPDPAEELARLHGLLGAPAEGEVRAAASSDLPLPELLAPKQPVALRADRDTIHIRRLGVLRPRGRWGAMKTLSGVAAIRGFALSAAPMVELRILIGEATVHSGPISSLAPDAASNGQHKTPFNIWIDVSQLPLGRVEVELQLLDARQHILRHRERVAIVEALTEADNPGSDAVVDAPPGAGASVEEQVRGRPSMIRPARRSLLPAPPRAVLIQRVDQLGDMVVSIPAIRRLRALFEGARLVGLLSRANAELAGTLDLFDDIVVVDFVEDKPSGRRTLPADRQRALREQLAPFAFDVAIDLSADPSLRPLLLLSGARFLHGFGRREFPWLSSEVDGHTPDPANQLETASHGAKLAAIVDWLAAMMGGQHRPEPRPGLGRERLASYGIGPEEPFAVLHGGARLAFSRWAHYPALAALILERTRLKIIMLSDDPDAELPAELAGSNRVRMVAGRIPFDDFDALLSACAVFVGNDSGPKHLAALRGAKVVSIHMARLNWSEWGQEGEGYVVSRRVPCAGCAIHHQPEECAKDFACIADITAEEVYGAVAACIAEAHDGTAR